MGFLQAWQHSAYAGPESWIIERFMDSSSGYLVAPDADRSADLKKLFGVNEA